MKRKKVTYKEQIKELQDFVNNDMPKIIESQRKAKTTDASLLGMIRFALSVEMSMIPKIASHVAASQANTTVRNVASQLMTMM